MITKRRVLYSVARDITLRKRAEVEAYIAEHTNRRFSHAICPTCYEREVLIDSRPPSPRLI